MNTENRRLSIDNRRDTLYHFKLEVEEELTEETEAITIYWINETIDRVEIDLVAIPELIKFINENF